MRLICLAIALFFAVNLGAQTDSVYTRAYLEKSTRFAWLTFGGDLNFLTGGTTRDTPFGTTLLPRLTVGGVHFWGHVDLYATFPLSFLTLQDVPAGLQTLELSQGVETGMRLYPLKLQPGRLSPFGGVSFRRIRYAQEAEESGFTQGTPGYGRIIYPAQFGLTYTSRKWHVSASGYYNFSPAFDYFISPTETAGVELDPFSFNLSLLRYIDTDAPLRSERAVGQINRAHTLLREKNALSAWFFGVGPSAALQLSKSPYLREEFPYFHDEYAAAILPDLALGRYFYGPDLNLNLTYRTYGNTYRGFDAEIGMRRHSVGVESVKFLFNWLGFVPFAGAAVTYENLRTTVNGTQHTERKPGVGIVVGWDIRVTRSSSSVLRTNLRYFPDLHLSVAGEKMMFDQLEFNFIQWVHFIGRRKALRGR